MADNELKYCGYTGSIEVSIEDGCLHGRILFIDDIVTYEGQTVGEIAAAFRESVDRYIAHCKETGKQPNKPYSGSTNVRIGQERHRALAQLAFRRKSSLNDLICQAVDMLLEGKQETAATQRQVHLGATTAYQMRLFQAVSELIEGKPLVFGTGSGKPPTGAASGKSNVVFFPASFKTGRTH